MSTARVRRRVRSYVVALAAVALALAGRTALDPLLREQQPFAPFYVAVALTTWFGGFRPGLVALVLGYLASDYFFMAPRFQINGPRAPEAIIESAIYFFVNFVILVLTHSMRRAELRARDQAQAARAARAEAEATLHELARQQAITEAARADAEAANRAKDDFLALLGHELRNPLAPVRNAVRVMHVLAPRDPKLERACDIIDRQVSHMARLVDDLFDASRIARGKITLQTAPVRLAEVITQAVETVRPLVERKAHTVRVALPTDAIWLEADRTRLVQVMSNLLTNAAKFTPTGGTIEIAAEAADGAVQIRVRDSGVGIAAEALERVFEPFVQEGATPDRQYGGLGIGLTLARRLVEMHGGEITVRSDGKGFGTTFTVTLPTAPAARVETPASAPSPASLPSSAPHARDVLVVEDNADAADSLMMFLELLGHRVQIASDGPTALRLAQASPPDAALVDIGLPGMSGYEVARRMRALPGMRGAVLIALTGYGREEDRDDARHAGFDRHMVKPVDLDALEALLAGVRAPVNASQPTPTLH